MASMDNPRPMGRFDELDEAECLRLLTSKHVGRVAWCGSRGPQVLPVNYTIVDGSVVFRTSPYSQLAKALYENDTAFQVDDVDEFLQAGWSVLVVGSATYLKHAEEVPKSLEDRPTPWAPGVRQMYIRIEPRSITGRRVIAG